jgi:HEAT repeat protein
VCGVVLLGGCPDTVAPTLSPPERLELENRALDLLVRAADSEIGDVSCNAIEALVRVAPRAGRPAFRKAATSASPMVRYAGLVALGELRDGESLRALVAATKDPHPHVRLAAAFAACRCGKDGYAGVLFAALQDAPEESVRADAASLLGRLQERRGVKRLRSALTVPANAKSKHVTLAIHGALAALGEQDSLRELINDSQGDPASRTDALLILSDLGNPEARDALRYRLLGVSEEYDEARLIAARGLGKLGYRDGYDLAMKMLTFTDPNANPSPDEPSRTYPMRSMAVHALAEIGDPRALPALRALAAAQEDPRLQVAASYAICRIVTRSASASP